MSQDRRAKIRIFDILIMVSLLVVTSCGLIQRTSGPSETNYLINNLPEHKEMHPGEGECMRYAWSFMVKYYGYDYEPKELPMIFDWPSVIDIKHYTPSKFDKQVYSIPVDEENLKYWIENDYPLLVWHRGVKKDHMAVFYGFSETHFYGYDPKYDYMRYFKLEEIEIFEIMLFEEK